MKRIDTRKMLALGAIGFGAWWLFLRKPSTPAAASTTTTTDKAAGAGHGPLGDPSVMGTPAYACNAAYRLLHVGSGHPVQAAPWADQCQAAGGRVPQNASEMYT